LKHRQIFLFSSFLFSLPFTETGYLKIEINLYPLALLINITLSPNNCSIEK
jgi:hypothetical protein